MDGRHPRTDDAPVAPAGGGAPQGCRRPMSEPQDAANESSSSINVVAGIHGGNGVCNEKPRSCRGALMAQNGNGTSGAVNLDDRVVIVSSDCHIGPRVKEDLAQY